MPSEVGTGLFQYYIKVIPTVYRDSWGYGMLTHQYTFTEKFKAFEMPKMNERGQLIPTMVSSFSVSWCASLYEAV